MTLARCDLGIALREQGANGDRTVQTGFWVFGLPKPADVPRIELLGIDYRKAGFRRRTAALRASASALVVLAV